jgi:predicted nucleic acid-binding protein
VTLKRAVVDSSGWIEVFTNGRQAEHFLALMADKRALVVPAITIFEVFNWVLREHGEARAIQAAAQLSHALRLPMADTIILVTARDQQARLHTMDSDFRGIVDVERVDSIP